MRSQTLDMNDPSGFFVRFAPTSGGIFLDMAIHDIDCARFLLGGPRARRVYASGHHRRARGARRLRRRRQWRGDDRIRRRQARGAVRVAHARARHGSDDRGVRQRRPASRSAQGLKLGGIDIADAHGARSEGLPTFWERFADAFVVEAQAFVDAVRDDAPLPLTLADATENTRIARAITDAFQSRKPVDLF